MKTDNKRKILAFITRLFQCQKRTENRCTARYDFSDIAEKLTWQGDAVAVQREIRDEW